METINIDTTLALYCHVTLEYAVNGPNVFLCNDNKSVKNRKIEQRSVNQ